jgi:arsenate reductase
MFKKNQMKKVYYLKTCDTCKRILKQWSLSNTFVFQEIKEQPITLVQLEEMHKLAGNYEALFSKRAKLYKERGLKNQDLSERDYKTLLLEHYTFLKRPVLIIANQIFIGNSKKTVENALKTLENEA